MGAAVVRAYGLDETVHRRVKQAVGDRYRAQMVAHRRASTLFPMAVMFYALAHGRRRGRSARRSGRAGGSRWAGDGVHLPGAATSWTRSSTCPRSTRTRRPRSRGGARSCRCRTCPVEIHEPSPASTLRERGARGRGGRRPLRVPGCERVLHGISLRVPAGGHVAIVGETGCGKTTFAKLLTRLADPSSGQILIGGVDLREVAPDVAPRGHPDGAAGRLPVRHHRCARTCGYGREGATDRDVETAFEELGLGGGWTGCPRGWTRWPASAARPVASASGSSWRWRARRSRRRAC